MLRGGQTDLCEVLHDLKLEPGFQVRVDAHHQGWLLLKHAVHEISIGAAHICYYFALEHPSDVWLDTVPLPIRSGAGWQGI